MTLESNERRAAARSRPHLRWALALGLLAAAGGLLGSGCDGDGSSDAGVVQAAVATPSPRTPGVVPSPTASLTSIATPQVLPYRPLDIDYKVKDVEFDALSGARAYHGQYAGGGYRIEVPDDWNGSVVYYAHGFRANPPDLTVSAPPIREYLVEHGYAWAASSYSANGYEPGIAARDMLALRDVVREQLGSVRRSYLYGQSMGGHVTALSLELYPDAYDGALSECGVVAGPEVLDYFLSYAALAGYLSGVNLNESIADPRTLGEVLRDEVIPELGSEPSKFSARGEAFANAIEHLTGGPRPFFAEGFEANYGFNFLVLSIASEAAGPSNAAAQNMDVHYTLDERHGYSEAELNRYIARVAANPVYADAAQYPEFAPMTGKITRPHLAIHNTGDLFVPISLQQSYRRSVDAAGVGDLLVQRAIRRAGHCIFTDEERIRAFEDLVAWTEGGPKPPGEDLTGDLRDAGRAFTSPLESNDPGHLTLP